MKLKGIKFGALGILGLCLASQAAFAQTKVFPRPSCDTHAATQDLHDRLASQPTPSHDGDAPWPGVFGTWTEPKRGTYVTIRFEELANAQWGIVRVTFYDVCTDEIMAVGAKVISSADWSKTSLAVRLRNFSLKGDNLNAVVTDLNQEVTKAGVCVADKDRKLEVRIEQPVGGGASRSLMDRFIVVKP